MLPSGTVTFLFTDIEGSTDLWELFPQAMNAVLARHDAILDQSIAAYRGQIVKRTGDGAHAVFETAIEALECAAAIQLALSGEAWEETGPIRVRMGLLSGEAELRAGDYYGPAVNRSARLMSLASGGQVLLSASTAELVRDQLPGEYSLADLGGHRLRNLDRPEHIFQLLHPELPADFPPLQSAAEVPNNLPVQLTSFIGREGECTQLKELLAPGISSSDGGRANESSRLVTLTGPGGTGKTRLSLQVGEELLPSFTDGVWLVELAPVTDEKLVVQTAAAVFGLQEKGGRPLLEILVDYLRRRSALLILDNCEHLIDECARLADTLLRSCPDLRILSSSREALGIGGERVFRLRSLALPPGEDGLTVEQVAGYEAIKLFSARAGTVKEDFALTAENAGMVRQICSRLDGIPLAIELAAARVRVLSPAQIAERLDDRFRLLTGGSRTALPRQRTLHALIDWSYDLLSEEECVLLRRLSVFSGSWTLEAAEEICGTDPLERYEVLDLLDQLVNKSLVAMDESGEENRYRMLETIRQFAQEKLAENQEVSEIRDRHLAFYLELNRRTLEAVMALHDAVLDNKLAAETDNIRAARAWALEHDIGAALTLASLRTPRLGRALPSAESLGYAESVMKEAESRPEFNAGATIENRRLIGAALVSAGTLSFELGRNPQALSYVLKGAEIAQEVGDLRTLGWARGIGGSVAYTMGDLEKADAWYREASRLAEKTGDRWMEAVSLVSTPQDPKEMSADSGLWEGWYRGMAMFEQGGDLWGQALGHQVAARRLMYAGHLESAKSHAEASLVLMLELGDSYFVNVPRGILSELARVTGDLDLAEPMFKEGASSWRDAGNLGAVARCMECLAFIIHARLQNEDQDEPEDSLRQERLERAAVLLGAADAIRQSYDSPMTAAEEPEYEQEINAISKLMGERNFENAWQRGRVLTIDQAVAFAHES